MAYKGYMLQQKRDGGWAIVKDKTTISAHQDSLDKAKAVVDMLTD